MDQLDENLQKLKIRVDARVEQMLIVQRAEVAEKEAVANSVAGSTNITVDCEESDHNAHTRLALPLPQGDDPTVAVPVQKPNLSAPKVLSNSEKLNASSQTFGTVEPAVSNSAAGAAADVVEDDADAERAHEQIRAHTPPMRRQGLLKLIFGRLLPHRF